MSMIVRIELGVLELELPAAPTTAQIDLAVEEATRRVHRDAFVAAVRRLEMDLLRDRTCPGCGGLTTIHDVDHRPIVTLAGKAGVAVRRLRCPDCGRTVSPLADLLPQGRHTLPVVERALRLATEIGYAKSSDVLKRLTGATISHEQIRRLALGESELLGRGLSQAADELFSNGACPDPVKERGRADTVVVAMDGGLVADRSTGESFEARVGVVWCGVAEVSKARRMLLDRRGHVGIEDTQTFARKMSVLAIQAGMLSAGTTIVIGDGAGWIRRTARDWFPGAIYVLDLYHLKHRVSELFWRKEDAGWCERVLTACVAGRPDEAIRTLRRYDPGADDRTRALHERLIGYIKANAVGIENYTRTDLFGSGCVEKAVDVLVSRRLKCRGMSWLKPGALGILKLKLLRFNGEWDDHWGSRFAEAA
jgi:hypothetical protein